MKVEIMLDIENDVGEVQSRLLELEAGQNIKAEFKIPTKISKINVHVKSFIEDEKKV